MVGIESFGGLIFFVFRDSVLCGWERRDYSGGVYREFYLDVVLYREKGGVGGGYGKFVVVFVFGDFWGRSGGSDEGGWGRGEERRLGIF